MAWVRILAMINSDESLTLGFIVFFSPIPCTYSSSPLDGMARNCNYYFYLHGYARSRYLSCLDPFYSYLLIPEERKTIWSELELNPGPLARSGVIFTQLFSPGDENQALQEFLQSCNRRQQHSTTLESYLIQPIQRILKYPLLLQQVMIQSRFATSPLMCHVLML